MSKFQNCVLILLAIGLGWGVIRAEAFMRRVDNVTETVNRTLDNMQRVEALMRQSQATIDQAGKVGHGLLDKAGTLRMRVESKPRE
jgi:hypothetical protein